MAVCRRSAHCVPCGGWAEWEVTSAVAELLADPPALFLAVLMSESSPAREEVAAAGKVRWVICALLFFATTINYIDRAVLGVLEPELQKITKWTATQYGNINATFSAAYAIGFLYAG
jgi:sugar phosphate permease